METTTPDPNEEVHVEPIPAPEIAHPAPALDTTPLIETAPAPAAALAPTAPPFTAEIAQLKLRANPDILHRLAAAKVTLVRVTAVMHTMVVDGFEEKDSNPTFADVEGAYWFTITDHRVEPATVPAKGQVQIFSASATCLF